MRLRRSDDALAMGSLRVLSHYHVPSSTESGASRNLEDSVFPDECRASSQHIRNVRSLSSCIALVDGCCPKRFGVLMYEAPFVLCYSAGWVVEMPGLFRFRTRPTRFVEKMPQTPTRALAAGSEEGNTRHDPTHWIVAQGCRDAVIALPPDRAAMPDTANGKEREQEASFQCSLARLEATPRLEHQEGHIAYILRSQCYQRELKLQGFAVAFCLCVFDLFRLSRTAARRGPVLCCADSNIAVTWPRDRVLFGGPRGRALSLASLFSLSPPLFSLFHPCSLFSEVDNLTAGCAKAGLRVVRIGRPEATRYDLEKFNLLEMVKATRLVPLETEGTKAFTACSILAVY